MPKPRAIAAFLGAALFAAGLSFGASLAAGEPHAATAAPGKHHTPAGVCVLVEPPKN
jgi:hypothetical protein